MSSYFNQIRRLKDSHHYIQEITRQFALYRATQDQVDNQVYKAYNRATTNRLIVKEQAAAPLKQAAEFWTPTVPQEPGPEEQPGAPTPVGTTTVMINFDHELEDRSTSNNDALFEFTNNQLLFAEGQGAQMNFAVNFNPTSNSTFDKLWIPFSNSTQLVYDTPNGFSILTRIYPITLADLGTQQVAAPAPLTSRMAYYGGPILNKYNVAIYNIWWGSGWNSGTPASDKTALQSSYNTIVNSDHFKGMWQYNGVKAPVIGNNNVVHTTTALPSAANATFTDINQVIDNCVTAGQVPNYRDFGEPAMALNMMDYRHLYIVHMPAGKFLPAGFNGASSVGRSLTPPQTIWYNWSAMNPPSAHLNQAMFPDYNYRQMAAQAWAHEIMHHLESPFPSLPCDSSSQGWGGWMYHQGSECGGSQHSLAGCGTRLRALSGTSVVTESYWSDMDGKCIAPGTGDTWTREPAPQPGGTIIRRYIFQKMDDLDNGATAALGSDGTVYLNVKKAGLEYKVKTAPGAVAVNTWADIWFTFSPSTNSPAIYVNNLKYTTPSSENLIWNNKHSHTIIGNYNVGATVGQFRGRMDEWRLYRNMLATAQQVDNFDANGLTITPVNVDSTQGVAIVNRCKIDSKLEPSPFKASDIAPEIIPPVGIVSFTGTSFTTTSFTVV